MNRATSLRKSSRDNKTTNTTSKGGPKRFTFANLRSVNQADLSKKLFRLIKTQKNVITSYETAGKETNSVATQLSQWGESTGDESVSDLSDKIGVLLAEIAELEDQFASQIEDSRLILKTIRNTESSVQPSRDKKAKITEQIAHLKHKEPESTKIVSLEQELVRAEAENLVAEAQLSNVTRQKLKETYYTHFAAVIERAQKQEILASHGRKLLSILDDTPVVPGDNTLEYRGEKDARQILHDAEEALANWKASEPRIPEGSSLDDNLLPGEKTTESPPIAEEEEEEEYSETQTTPAKVEATA